MGPAVLVDTKEIKTRFLGYPTRSRFIPGGTSRSLVRWPRSECELLIREYLRSIMWV